MTSREQLIKIKLEKLCQCPICLDVLKDAKILNCQHTFCKSCLEHTCLQNDLGLMSLFCPTCRARQPLVYHRSDIARINGSIFVNQVLDLLNVWNDRLRVISVDAGKLSTKDAAYSNTKVTSVYEAVNINTLERIAQVSVQEYGSRDEKVRLLESEIFKLKKNNAVLLMDNLLLKMKTEEENDLTTTQGEIEFPLEEVSTRSLRQEAKKIIGVTENDDLKQNNSNDKLVQKYKTVRTLGTNPQSLLSSRSEENMRQMPFENEYKTTSDSGFHQGESNSEEEKEEDDHKYFKDPRVYENTSHSVKEQDNSFDDTLKPTALDTSFKPWYLTKSKYDIKNLLKKESETTLCWRCFRSGHTGTKCNAETTKRGRTICRNCNFVGHDADTCAA